MTHDIDERKRWLAFIVLCLGVLGFALTVSSCAMRSCESRLGDDRSR